ncbi:MAG: hypothetical protein ACYC6Y_28885 [Thermoguttaceae bacterium]
MLAEQPGYKVADEKGIRQFTFPMPKEPLRRFRLGVQNDEQVRLALSEIEIFSAEHPDISYTVMANFEEVQHSPEGELPVPTADDKASGYVLFAPSYLRRIFPNSVALPDERVTRVAISASQGEYEPVMVAVSPLRPLGQCTVKVTDLAGPGGARIAAADIDIRTVRYWRQSHISR